MKIFSIFFNFRLALCVNSFIVSHFMSQVPTLQASVICEDVRQEANGIQSLIGVLTIIPAANAPINLLKLAVWTRWINGAGKFTQNVRILAPDGKTVIGEANVEFEMQTAELPHSNTNIIVGVQLPDFGVYRVEIALDGNQVINYPLIVAQIQQQQPAPAGN